LHIGFECGTAIFNNTGQAELRPECMYGYECNVM